MAVPAWAPSTGRRGQMDSWGLLSHQTSWISEPRASKTQVNNTWRRISELDLWPPHTCKCTLIHAQMKQAIQEVHTWFSISKKPAGVSKTCLLTPMRRFPSCIFATTCTPPPLSYRSKMLWECFYSIKWSVHKYFYRFIYVFGLLNMWHKKVSNTCGCRMAPPAQSLTC